MVRGFSSRCLCRGKNAFWGAHSPKPSGTASPRTWLHPGWGANTTSRILASFIASPQDKVDIESLLSPENVNRDALLSYAKEAANFSTNYRLPELEFALNHRDLPDVDMFDFTCMTRSENAALVREHNGARLLIGLVGDCLVEVRVPLAAPCASVSPLPARCFGCNIFPLPKRFLPRLPGAPHSRGQSPQVGRSGMLWWGYPLPQPYWRSGVGSGWRSSPAPPQTQPYRPGRKRPPIFSLRVLPPLPTFIPGQAQQLPASLLPAAPTGRAAPAPSLSAFPFAALLAAGHRRGQGLPRRLRRSVDGAAVGGRDPPTGGAGREVSVLVPLGWFRSG